MTQPHAIYPFRSIPFLLLPLILLISGIYTYSIWHLGTVSCPTVISFYIIVFSCAMIMAWYKPSSRTLIIISLIAVAGGFLRTMQIRNSYESFPFQQDPVTIKGSVKTRTKTPQARMGLCITITLHSVKTKTSIFHTNHTIQLYTLPSSTMEVGDVVEIKNVHLKKPNNNDFGQYLLKEGILTTIFATQIEYELLYRPIFSLRRWLNTYKTRLLSSFQKQLSPATFNLFSSLFLGVKNKKALEAVNNQFKYWGILHYLARSGLHLAVVITIYETAFRLIPLSFALKNLILLLLGILYFFLSWPSISFIRAFIIFICYKLHVLSKIPPHFLHILIMTCLLVLIINPIQLFFLDFQLSFCLTFALGWLNLYRTDQIQENSGKY